VEGGEVESLKGEAPAITLWGVDTSKDNCTRAVWWGGVWFGLI